VGNVTTSNNSIFLGTSHSDHQLQYDTFIPGISYGTGLQTNLGFANVPISRPTCNINTDDTRQTVTLPTVDSNDFKGVGTAIGPIGFSMRLNCDAKVTLSAFMTDANSPANVSSSLTLLNSSTAAGIGIQVLVNDSTTPVIFGTKKWYIDGSDNAAATTYTIPFLAKYVQTNSIIRAGTVSAHSVISFFYE
jgi:type 1 fimbria pilin